MIKLRFLPLFRIQDKFRHNVNCLGNQFIHAKYMNHYEKNIMNYPDIFITGDYKFEDGKNITNLDINYHNGLFNNSLGEKEIIFSIRVNTTFENRHFYSNSDIYIGDIRLSLSSKGYLYLCSKEFKNRFRFLLENYKTKNNIKEGEIEIEFPKYENLVKRNNHILFTCYIMSKLLSIKIDSNKISSNIVTDIMNNYMGNKKNNIQDIFYLVILGNIIFRVVIIHHCKLLINWSTFEFNSSSLFSSISNLFFISNKVFLIEFCLCLVFMFLAPLTLKNNITQASKLMVPNTIHALELLVLKLSRDIAIFKNIGIAQPILIKNASKNGKYLFIFLTQKFSSILSSPV